MGGRGGCSSEPLTRPSAFEPAVDTTSSAAVPAVDTTSSAVVSAVDLTLFAADVRLFSVVPAPAGIETLFPMVPTLGTSGVVGNGTSSEMPGR